MSTPTELLGLAGLLSSGTTAGRFEWEATADGEYRTNLEAGIVRIAKETVKSEAKYRILARARATGVTLTSGWVREEDAGALRDLYNRVDSDFTQQALRRFFKEVENRIADTAAVTDSARVTKKP